MRRILVERARRKRGPKAGGGRRRVELPDVPVETTGNDFDLVALSESLDALQLSDPRSAELVKLRFFAGLTSAQAAEVHGVSVATADNDWAYAKGWLKAELTMAMIQFRAGRHDESRTTLELVQTSISRNESTWQKKLSPLGAYEPQVYSTLVRDETAWYKLLEEAETLIGVRKAADNPTRWIGKAFMPRWRAQIENANGDVGSPSLPYTISRVEGDRFWFGNNSIARSHIVPLEDAGRYFTGLLEHNPQSVFAHNHLGIASRATGNYDKAIEQWRISIGSMTFSPPPLRKPATLSKRSSIRKRHSPSRHPLGIQTLNRV